MKQLLNSQSSPCLMTTSEDMSGKVLVILDDTGLLIHSKGDLNYLIGKKRFEMLQKSKNYQEWLTGK